MSPPVVKALQIGRIAKENGWHGSVDSEVIDRQRVTVLRATRNDEEILLCYAGNTLDSNKSKYSLFDWTVKISCPSEALEKIESWPDLLKLFKRFPNMNRPNLVRTYRRLPFTHDEPNDVIMSKLIGHQLFWYSHEAAKLYCDVVLPPRKTKTDNFRIVDIGHRKLFHFIGVAAGFRSVLLDTLIKVG